MNIHLLVMRKSHFFLIYLLISAILFSSTISNCFYVAIEAGNSQNSIPEPFFNITILTIEIPPSPDVVSLIRNELENIGIGVNIDIVATGTEVWARIGDHNVPGYDEGGFDIVNVGFLFEPFTWDPCGPIDWQVFYQMVQLEEYIELRDNHRTELDEVKRTSIVKEIQELMYDSSNIIVLFHESEFWVFKDNWDLSQEDLMAIRTTTMRSGWADFGFADVNPLIIARPVETSSYHFALHSEEPYFYSDIFYNSRYPSLIWQGLYERNRTDDFNWTPLLAKSMPEWTNGNKTATIELRDDVFFADGHPLTSHDVVETYRMHLTPGFHSWSYAFFVEHFASNESISAIDDLTVQFNLIKPYPHALSYFHYGIFPVHIWGNHTHPAVNDYQFDAELLEDVVTTDTSNYSIGTGPYMYTNISADCVKLKAVNPYWNGNVRTEELHFTYYDVNYHEGLSEEEEDQVIADLKAGKIDLVEKHILINLTKIQEAEGINYHNLVTEGSRAIQINMNHKILGTGENTPLKTPEAAKYIRQAINHVIPRQKINELYLGRGFSGATVVTPFVRGFDDSLEPYKYNTTRAKELMGKAGYEYLPSESPTTIISSTATESSTPTPSFEVIIVLTSMCSISFLAAIIRRRREN